MPPEALCPESWTLSLPAPPAHPCPLQGVHLVLLMYERLTRAEGGGFLVRQKKRHGGRRKKQLDAGEGEAGEGGQDGKYVCVSVLVWGNSDSWDEGVTCLVGGIDYSMTA